MALTLSSYVFTPPAILPQMQWLDGLSPQDAKVALMRQFLPSSSCFGGIVAGAMGSIAAEHPFPFLVGLSQCLPEVHAQQKIGGEFQVNTYNVSRQEWPTVAVLNNDQFVVTWYSDGQDGDASGVFGQVFESTGVKASSEFQINTYTAFYQWYPSVAVLNNNNFVVTWDSSNQDNTGPGVFGQILNKSGGKIGGEFQVNTYTPLYQQYSSTASFSNGDFVVTWQSSDRDGDSYGISGQLYTGTGTEIGNEFIVNTYTPSMQLLPSVATFSSGNFVVVWQSDGRDGDGNGISAQLFDSNSTKIGNEFQVNSYTTGWQTYPEVATIENGNFMVTWQSDNEQDGSSQGVFGQVFNATGSKVGTEIQVNTYTDSGQLYSALAGLVNNRFVVTWSSIQDGSVYGVYGQLFDEIGMKLGNEFQINSYTDAEQLYPEVAGFSNGNFVVTWTSNGQDGDSWGVYAQLFDNTTQPMTTGTTGVFGITGLTGSLSSTGSIVTSGTSGSTGSLSTTGEVTTGNLITTSGSTTGMRSTPASPPSSSSSSVFWLWPVLGAIGGTTCLAATAYVLVKRRKDSAKLPSSEEMDPTTSLSPERTNKTHSIIGKKYALINKISRVEADILFEQTGVVVDFLEGKNRTKVLLGQGNFGKMRIARNLKTGVFAGVKKIKGQKAIDESKSEGVLQAKLEGKPNIMPIWDFVETVSSSDEPVLYQFMPLAGFGNGEELQARLDGSCKEEVIIHVAQGMLTGLYHMHQAGIYHLDIKLSNLVLDMRGEVRIIDFGCAKELSDGNLDEQAIGDTRYFSPERIAFARQIYQGREPLSIAAEKVDAWALGVSLLELAIGKYPFDQTNLMEKIHNWDVRYFQEKLDQIEFLQQPGDLNEIVRELLNPVPEARLSIEEAHGRLRKLSLFNDSMRSEFFLDLKHKEISIPSEVVQRDQDENYGDVYVSRHGVPSFEDNYGGVADDHTYEKTPSAVSGGHEYAKSPGDSSKYVGVDKLKR